jgi:hypothetical protein
MADLVAAVIADLADHIRRRAGEARTRGNICMGPRSRGALEVVCLATKR